MAYLLAGFDLERLGTMAVAVDDGNESGTATISEGTFAHRALTSATVTGYLAFPSAVGDALDAILTTSGSVVSFTAATLSYSIALDTPNSLDFTEVTLGSTAGHRLAAALGYTYQHAQASGGSSSAPYDITLSGAASYTSNVTPYYALALAKAGPSDYSRDYETSGQTRRQVSANGTAYSIGPRTYERRTKFGLRFNTLAGVFADEASTSAPWTYEHLVKHARAHQPILLSYSAEDLVYKLVKAEFDEDARKAVWKDFHGLWDLSVEGQVLGRL